MAGQVHPIDRCFNAAGRVVGADRAWLGYLNPIYAHTPQSVCMTAIIVRQAHQDIVQTAGYSRMQREF
jgi:hypothetical protein